MIRYVLKRLLLLIPILLGVSLLIFLIMELTPGDPAIRILGIEAPPEALAQLRVDLGLNKPLPIRFFDYIYNIVTGFDFGMSWRTKNPVFVDILPRIPVSATLAFFGIIFATLFGIPLGVLSAVKQYSKSDTVLRVISTILVAVPTFFLAMLLILGFSSYLGWLPSGGAASLKSYILPVITCGGPYGCAILRMTRSTMLEEIRQDYVRTARAKGVPNNIITYKHALKNALLPVVTTIGQNFGAILGGSVVAESVFSLPGIGSLVILGIKSKDTPTVVASVLLIAFFFAIIMLVVDLLYAFIDPRIRAKYSKA
ncbi:MAG: ABC transporter permease [Bacillota bacterium]|nr:ABC transporter permease [Bacillota bacterium]MDW7677650.1 ABC transporter permease [Bacillota bacterium]